MSLKETNASTAYLPTVNPTALRGKTVIITGEVPYDRSTAHKILENAGATIAKSLNKSVNLVVRGEAAGEKKLEKARATGVEMRDWYDVLDKIQSDDIVHDEDGDQDDDEEHGEGVETDGEELEDLQLPKEKSKGGASTDLPSNFSLDDKQVLVTGTIAGHTRKTITSLLESYGATVKTTLKDDLDVVILGANPGPDKLKKIADWQLQTVAWNTLASHLGLDYGEDDDEADEAHPEPQTVSSAPASIDGTNVLITGTVDGYTRATAEAALKGKGAKIAKTLNKEVELVVLGVNPGPDKIRKINDLGIATCEWEDLAESLNLPQPSEPPKKKRKA